MSVLFRSAALPCRTIWGSGKLPRDGCHLQASQPAYPDSSRTPSCVLKVADRQRNLTARASAGSAEDDEIDFAVLRMTLGIPGFDETQLPRVVAILCVILAFVNHQATSGSVTRAQSGAEVIVAVLAAAAATLPLLGSRLKEAQAGRSQAASDPSALGGTQLLAISSTLQEAARQDLAWASYSLLRNTGSCTVLVCSPGRVWLARGLVQGFNNTSADALPQISEAIDKTFFRPQDAPTYGAGKSSVYLPDRRSIAARAGSWTFLPAGIQTLLLQRIEPLADSGKNSWAEERSLRAERHPSSDGVPVNGTKADGKSEAVWLLLAAGRPRALSRRERLWAAAIAAKLYDAIRT